MPRIVTNLWFDGDAEEAARFYVGIFPNSRITGTVARHDAVPGGPDLAGTPVTVDFELDGQPFTGINGGPGSRSPRRSRCSPSVPTRRRSTTTGTHCLRAAVSRAGADG